MKRRKKKERQNPRPDSPGLAVGFIGVCPIRTTPWSPEMKEKMCGKPASVQEVARRLFTI